MSRSVHKLTQPPPNPPAFPRALRPPAPWTTPHPFPQDTLLTEWITPKDADSVRPLPPPLPQQFHRSLRAGDPIDVFFEAGWWPACIKASVKGGISFELRSDAFAALCRAVPATQIRPRWRWAGGAWHQVTADKP